MSSSNQRLVEYIDSIGISKARFAQTIGITPQTLSNYTNGRSTLDANRIAKIADQYPDLNIEWLVTGRGSMKKTEEANTQTVYEKLLNNIEEELINRLIQRMSSRKPSANFNHQYAMTTAAAF